MLRPKHPTMHTLGGCREDSIRLVGGETVRQGRVEVCHGGVWGSLCKEGGGQWLNTDADLVCRQLQFQQQDERGIPITCLCSAVQYIDQ